MVPTLMSEPHSPTLFETPNSEPLAARMRPRTLAEYIGQDHIVGPGRLLRRAIEADQLSSLIFYGPPGTGKTTLARVIANSTRARFAAINAVLGGVKDIREAVAAAQASRRGGVRTILFVDEVHRFNKAQQDALLPWVENGTVILIGATTENPFFEVNKALVSRSRIFQLVPLTEDDLRAVAHQALGDAERGYGHRQVDLRPEALDHLVNVANGDARALLDALELAVETTEPTPDGVVVITREVAEESIQRRAVLYDKEGDAHFDTISAFIKSVRGSDPDAALYWLSKMVYAGEDPRFIFRRLLILASEDIGLADPHALPHTAAAAQAFDYVGLPEGRYHLAQATLYLATAAKSNSTMGFFDALATVQREREAEVPSHLRDGSRDAEGFGHGAGYAYPHAYRDHWVAQQYLPEALQGKVFYDPSASGYEAGIRADVARRREAQLAAMLEQDQGAPGEVLTVSPKDASRDRWLERTVSSSGERLAEVRDAVFELARPRPHHLVLDLAAGTGLLTWEAARRTPEGQVWALEADAAAARTLEEQAANLSELQRPVVLNLPFEELTPGVLGDIRFDVALGRDVLSRASDVQGFFSTLLSVMAPEGEAVLAEPHSRRAQRLYRLLDLGDRPDVRERLAERLEAAEEAIYEGVEGRFGPAPDEVREAALAAGFAAAQLVTREISAVRRISHGAVEGWFRTGGPQPSYAELLGDAFSEEELAELRSLYLSQLAGSERPWTTVVYLLRLSAA